MTGLRGYLLSVLLAALLCSILQKLLGSKGTAGRCVKLLSGLFMAVTVLSPVITFDWEEIPLYPMYFLDAGKAIAEEGTIMAQEARDAIIITETQAYIQDKAASLGAVLEVDVRLQNHIPESISLRGAVSPGAKSRLTAWICDTFNIPPEGLQWN